MACLTDCFSNYNCILCRFCDRKWDLLPGNECSGLVFRSDTFQSGLLAAALGFTYLFSSLFKSGAISSIITFILLILGFGLIDSIVAIKNIEPWFSLGYGSAIITNVFTVPFPSHVMSIPGSSASIYTATIPEGLVIMVAYFVATTLLGLFLFESKEFN